MSNPKTGFMYKSWWKIAAVILLVYTITGGLLMDIPRLSELEETIRNMYFHVALWFAMMILFTISVVYAIMYLNKKNLRYDIISKQFATTGIFIGLLGYATGAIWMSYTWADPNASLMDSFSTFSREPKLIGAAIALLVYSAYLVLRQSIPDIDRRARVSAVYNIFAFALLYPAIKIIPSMVESLHPVLDFKEVDNKLRRVFYPAVIGWTLLAVWITTIKIRIQFLKEKDML